MNFYTGLISFCLTNQNFLKSKKKNKEIVVGPTASDANKSLFEGPADLAMERKMKNVVVSEKKAED